VVAPTSLAPRPVASQRAEHSIARDYSKSRAFISSAFYIADGGLSQAGFFGEVFLAHLELLAPPFNPLSKSKCRHIATVIGFGGMAIAIDINIATAIFWTDGLEIGHH
jgi:hypothetical protein